MILLDTHVLLWLRVDDPRLGPHALREIDSAWQSGNLAVSAISFWELARLHAKGRIALPEDVTSWRREQLQHGLVELPVDGAIGMGAASLAGLHADPADRIIVATALAGHRLLTADARILQWRGDLDCMDAGR